MKSTFFPLAGATAPASANLEASADNLHPSAGLRSYRLGEVAAQPLGERPLSPAPCRSAEPANSCDSDASGTNVAPRPADEVESRQARRSKRALESELTRRLSQVRLNEDFYAPLGAQLPDLARLSVEAQDLDDRDLVARAATAVSKRRAEVEVLQSGSPHTPGSAGKRSRGSALTPFLVGSPQSEADLLGKSAPW